MAFKTSTTKKTALKGRYLMLFIDDQFIPLSTSCDVDMSVSMIDPETKDDSIYQTLDPDSKQWSANFEGQLDQDCDTLRELKGYYNNNKKATLLICSNNEQSDNSIDEEGGDWSETVDTDAFGLKGEAYLTDLKISGPLSGKATFSGTFTGTGELKNWTPGNDED